MESNIECNEEVEFSKPFYRAKSDQYPLLVILNATEQISSLKNIIYKISSHNLHSALHSRIAGSQLNTRLIPQCVQSGKTIVHK
jgi:hypothetical protein